MKADFNVTGMGCSACVAAVERAVKALEGITEVSVSLIENAMTVDFDESKLSVDKIIEAVTAAGYGASLKDSVKEEEKPKKKRLFF